MSVCVFIAADCPLPEVRPTENYPLHINIDTNEIYDGGADDNFFLLPFDDVSIGVQGVQTRLKRNVRFESK